MVSLQIEVLECGSSFWMVILWVMGHFGTPGFFILGRPLHRTFRLCVGKDFSVRRFCDCILVLENLLWKTLVSVLRFFMELLQLFFHQTIWTNFFGIWLFMCREGWFCVQCLFSGVGSIFLGNDFSGPDSSLFDFLFFFIDSVWFSNCGSLWF